jgi:hypothetical protein
MELVLFPARTSEEVNWSNTGVKVWDMIVQKDGMGNGHGP